MKQRYLALAALLAVSGVSSTALAAADRHPLPGKARDAAASIVAKGVTGVTVVVARNGTEISHEDFGAIAPTAQLPIASASKWLTAAVVMQLVGEGKLSLDKPISTWLPSLAHDAGVITLRQLLSQTSGLGMPGAEMKQDHRISLAQSAKQVTDAPLAHPPGTVFVYGGPGFQVAGAVVEAVTGKPWAEVFRQRIGGPLAMRHTYWTHIGGADQTPAQVAETRNPVLQGGAVSTTADYMHFLAMMAGDGVFEGRRVLKHDAVESILTDQTAGATMTPSGVPMLADAHYALGNWCETWDSHARCSRSSSLGAWGVYPWIDRTSGLYGMVFFYEKKDAFRLLPDTSTIVREIIAANPLSADKQPAIQTKRQ
jgi:CubicO group peptidase (beta-lactamase class C family)